MFCVHVYMLKITVVVVDDDDDDGDDDDDDANPRHDR